jgi:hypothetical protein
VVVAVMTDGEENASRHYTFERIQQMIERCGRHARGVRRHEHGDPGQTQDELSKGASHAPLRPAHPACPRFIRKAAPIECGCINPLRIAGFDADRGNALGAINTVFEKLQAIEGYTWLFDGAFRSSDSRCCVLTIRLQSKSESPFRTEAMSVSVRDVHQSESDAERRISSNASSNSESSSVSIQDLRRSWCDMSECISCEGDRQEESFRNLCKITD